MKSAFFVLLAAAWAASAAAQSPGTSHHMFHDAQKWAHVFDDPSRDAWQKPHEVIQALALKPSAVVADIGAGTGYFSSRLARMVPDGKVYAQDIEPDMVKYLAERAQREHLPNMVAVRGKPGEADLPEPVDLALLVDVYHHIGARRAYFENLKNSLKAGGRVAIIDFRKDSPDGPPPAERIAPAEVKKEMAAAGYAAAQAFDFLPNQYFLVFKPSVAAK